LILKNVFGRELTSPQRITKDIYEAKMKQYDTELNRIEDKLKSVDETDYEIDLPPENWTSYK
jgi:hypothetical protein